MSREGGNGRGCLGQLVAYLVFMGVVVGWAEFLFKPLVHTPIDGGLWAIAADLTRLEPETYGWPIPGAGYIFFLTSLVVLLAALIMIYRPVRGLLSYLDAAEAPITVLDSKIRLHFEDIGLERCRVSREQLLHANQVVDAYHYNQSTFHGEVLLDERVIDSRIDDEPATKELMTRVVGKNVETIELFREPLPTNRFLTYVPHAIASYLYHQWGWFQRTIVKRSLQGIQLNEYNVESPVFQITLVRYPIYSITITLDFPKVTAPPDADVKAYLISSNAVRIIPVVPDSSTAGRKLYCARLKRLKVAETFRLTWKNDRLEQARRDPSLFPAAPAAAGPA